MPRNPFPAARLEVVTEAWPLASRGTFEASVVVIGVRSW